jgi:hypothetical protein
MSSTEEQPENEQADSNIDTQQDVGRIALSNCLRLLNLENIIGLINPQWAEGHYDPEIKYSNNGYILSCLLYYTKEALVDDELRCQLVEHFSEWEEKDWKTVTQLLRDKLRKTLRAQGCYIPINNLTMAKNLFNTVQNPVEEWPQEAIVQQIRLYGGFNAKSRYSRVQSDGTFIQQLSPPRITTKAETRYPISLPLRDSIVRRRNNTNTVDSSLLPSPVLQQQADDIATRPTPPEIEPPRAKQQPLEYDLTAGTVKATN